MLICVAAATSGQTLDSGEDGLEVRAEVLTAGHIKSAPLWMTANRWGLVPESGIVAEVAGTYRWSHGTTPVSAQAVASGQVLVENATAAVRPTFLFAGLAYRSFQLAGGTLPIVKGHHAPDLSVGSLTHGNNARPIPRVYAGFPEYVTFPFSRGLIEVKGSISHGWLEDDRTVARPWLHEKDAYLRLNDPFGWGVSLYRGLIHEVMWSGTLQDGTRQPSGFDDFLRVFTSASGGADASQSDQINALGNTLGMWDVGIVLDRPRFRVTLFHQHYFEDGSGYDFSSGVTGEQRWLRLRDGLSGIVVERTAPGLVESATYEYMDTRNQSGSGYHAAAGGFDNYWENGPYRTGWTYLGRTIGNALVTVDGTGADLEFVHTRIVAHHLGIAGTLPGGYGYRVRGTYWRGYGTYGANVPASERPTAENPDGDTVVGDSVFRNGRPQWSFAVDVTSPPDWLNGTGLFATAGVFWDTGMVYGTGFGGTLSVGWRWRQE